MPSNPGPPLVSVIFKRGEDGGQITRTEQAKDHAVAAPTALNFTYGVNEVAVVHNHRNERVHITETQDHPQLGGYFWKDGRKINVLTKVVEAEHEVSLLPGMVLVDVQPRDQAHSQMRVERDASATESPGSAAVVKLPAQWDDLLMQYIQPYERLVAVATAKPVIGDTYDGGIIVDGEDGPRTNDTEKYQIIYTAPAVIPSWAEWDSRGFSYPGFFEILPLGVIAQLASIDSLEEVHRPGVVYSQRPPRVASLPMKLIHIFTYGQPEGSSLPRKFYVDSPGIASNVFRIGANYIHPEFTLYDASGVLEYIPASTPSNYRVGDTIIADVDSKKYKGNLYHTQIWLANELGFGPDSVEVRGILEVWLAESEDGGIKNLQSFSKVILDGAEGAAADVYGRSGGDPFMESMAVSTSGPDRSDVEFRHIDMVNVTVFGSEVVWLRASGRHLEGRFDFSDNPSPGETWTFRIVGAKYNPADFGYTFVNTDNWYEVTGGATIGPGAVPADGYYYRDGAVNGQPAFYKENGLVTLLYDNVAKYRLALASDPTNHYLEGGGIGNPASSVDDYNTGIGTFTGTPVVTIVPAVALSTANRVKIGLTRDATRANLFAALTEAAGSGTTYFTVTDDPFFKHDQTEESSTSGRLLLTLKPAGDFEVSYTGTAQGTWTETQSGEHGAKIIKTSATNGEYVFYNASNLRNLDYKVNVPPQITDAETEVLERVEETEWRVHYRMQAEVSLEYEFWDSGTSSWAPGTTPIPTSEGEDLAEVDLAETTTKIKFLVSNSAQQGKRLNMHVTYVM